MALSQAKIDQLGKHLEQGQYANAEDMVTLKELVDYEVNTRRHQNYKITTEVPKQFGQFDTAKFINNLLGGLRILNKNKFELVIQNWTFIRALYEIWRKIKKLMEYQEYTKYPDNAGCDGECRGLCSSCSSSCVGGSSGSGSVETGGGTTVYKFNGLDGKTYYGTLLPNGKMQILNTNGQPIAETSGPANIGTDGGQWSPTYDNYYDPSININNG